MGRQAYLTRLALGRSAFEPSQTITQTDQYIQLSSDQQELPSQPGEADNKYIQLYDERGNPINPRAHEHGRSLREAQNDVLSSIGVVERRHSPSHDLNGSYLHRAQQIEDEEAAAHFISLTTTIAHSVCTFWIGSLRAKVLTFRFHDALPFAQIVASEWRLSGKRLIHPGFESKLLSILSIEGVFSVFDMLRPVDRLLAATAARGKTRRFFRFWKPLIDIGFRLGLELLLYPFTYHSRLQRLGLVPVWPLFPPLNAFIPFSASSPLKIWSPYYDATNSTSNMVMASLTSQFVFICIEHIYDHWAHSITTEALELAIIHPTKPDTLSRGYGRKTLKATTHGLQKQIQGAIGTLMRVIGWGQPLPGLGEGDGSHQTELQDTIGDSQTIQLGGGGVTNLNHLELPLAPRVFAVPVTHLGDVLPPPTPPSAPASPTASQTSQSDNDPRIRITSSREGIVEMEVHLPAHVLTQYTEIAESGPPSPSHHDDVSLDPSHTIVPQTYHRITQLSLEPSHLLAGFCSEQIADLVLLPLSAVSLRLIALHYLATRGGHIGRDRVHNPLSSLSDLTWSSIGVQASRIALCAVLEFAANLTFWGGSYLAITWTGTHAFGWGTL